MVFWKFTVLQSGWFLVAKVVFFHIPPPIFWYESLLSDRTVFSQIVPSTFRYCRLYSDMTVYFHMWPFFYIWSFMRNDELTIVHCGLKTYANWNFEFFPSQNYRKLSLQLKNSGFRPRNLPTFSIKHDEK